MSGVIANTSNAVARELCPGGILRVGINLGNPVIATRQADGALHGIGPALGRELGKRLGTQPDFVTYDTAGKLAEAVRTGAWDVGFLAIDPERATDLAFTDAYVLIEGTYMVRVGSPLQAVGDVDRTGLRVLVGDRTAYDLFLTRHLRHAQIVRAPSSREAIERFLTEDHDAVAGVKQPLLAKAASVPGLRVIEGNFMVIRQAAAVPKQHVSAHAYVAHFIEDMKSSGFAARALAASGVEGAVIAPAAG
ncbi:MAG: transporter substrate-binding domain-containing protein [Casimicrobiaceae bacterium]